MIRIIKAGFIVLFCILEGTSSAQAPARRLTLPEVLKLAAEQSPDALIARNQYYNSYWQYKIFRTDFLPQLSIDGSSDLNRSITPVTLSTGEDIFVERNLSSSSGNLSLSQNVGYSGTQLFLNSGIKRIDIINDPVSTSFLSTPVVIGFRQPLLSFNAFRWQLRIEPLKFTEAKRQYMEAMEEVSIDAVNAFFDLFLAQINLDIALKNLANTDTLYKIAQGRYNLGKIGENELLQIELSALNSETAVTQARLDAQVRTFTLKKFLGIKDNLDITLEAPVSPPKMKIDYPVALEQALKNRKKTLELERQLIEAERDVAQARGESRFKANLYGTYGLTKTAPDLEGSYISPLDQQQLTFGLQVPIIDWGRAGARVKMAKAAQDLVKTTVEQEKMNFEQEIFLAARQYEIQDKQFFSAAKADTIGIKRYEVAKQRYYIGKIDITSLNIAVNEKDIATRAYVETLKNYWNFYYRIRKLTLFDFRNNTIIDTKLEIK